ncbi:MAG: 2'-5' RNA ligase family protein [Candidatus Acidiferrales bacterium]
MQGIVSLVDGEERERVEKLWSELRQDFGVRGIHTKRFPHFSYHVAEAYDLGRVQTGLARIAREIQPFVARTSGIGIFTRKEPVLYLPVVRAAELEVLRRKIAASVESATETSNEYYAEDIWIPHVTIAEGDVDILVLPEIVRRFGARNFRWEIRVSNLALIRATESVQEICFRCEFGGK